MLNQQVVKGANDIPYVYVQNFVVATHTITNVNPDAYSSSNFTIEIPDLQDGSLVIGACIAGWEYDGASFEWLTWDVAIQYPGTKNATAVMWAHNSSNNSLNPAASGKLFILWCYQTPQNTVNAK